MKPEADWSGTWPNLTFEGGFQAWFLRKLLLGLEVMFSVALVVLATAAKMAGQTLLSYSILGALCVAVIARYDLVHRLRF